MATFDRAVARNTRPDEVDFIAFGHPLFEAIVEECRALELRGLATAKRVRSEKWAGLTGLLTSLVLEFTDGRNETVARRFHQVFVDGGGHARPEVPPKIRALANLTEEAPVLSSSLRELAANVGRYADFCFRLAQEAAALLEEEIQEARARLVALMRSDLDTYAKVKEARLKEKLAEARQRLREGREQMVLLGDESERRRQEATLACGSTSCRRPNASSIA